MSAPKRWRAELSAVAYDDTRYEVGEEFDAPAEDMAQLEAAGVVVPADPSGKPVRNEDRSSAAAAAIADLVAEREGYADDDARREAHWTKGGKPRLPVVRTRTGLRDLTGMELDDAWAAHLAAAAGE